MKFEVNIFVPDKPKPFYKKAIAEYEKRLGRYCKISYRFIRKEKEWEKHFQAAAQKCLILPGRDSLTSEQFSEQIGQWDRAGGTLSFFVGGEHLLPSSTDQNPVIHLSDFSMNAGLSAVILYEQIYRGYRILHHHPYHK